MALSRTLSNLHKHISSTAAATVTTAFRHQIRRNNSTAEFEQPFSKNEVYNGNLIKGYPLPYLFYHTNKSYAFRLDVPGIRDSDLRCTAHGSKFSFSAQESKPHRFGSGHWEPRYFEAQFEFDPLVYEPERFTTKVKNGVLLIHIPKIPGSPRMGWMRFNIGRVESLIDVEGKVISIVPNPNY